MRRLGLDQSLFTLLLNAFDDLNSNDSTMTLEASTLTSKMSEKKVISPPLSALAGQVVVDLKLQYRMNAPILSLANRLTYSNRMECANKTISEATIKNLLSSEDIARFDRTVNNIVILNKGFSYKNAVGAYVSSI
ncbi:unnamed protein product [Protopolystoma xenopodis]|uniref:Uncharacterized protein n=1 Tax=Protopolystoma xenopodis TaxID=117903 RepID=A0A448WFG3_9PLAT|nr:unnamed protein product [Protopolystoma xenopodis]